MSLRLKTALFALGAIAVLTGVKFTFYYVSGSMAVLSEAWHSVSDIGATLLAVLAVLAAEDNPTGKSPDSFVSRTIRRILYFDPELITAVVISVLLMSVSGSILYLSINKPAVEVQRPLLTGIVFIIISFGSFIIYRVERSVAVKEQSAALQADSTHHFSDMTISLLTGLSLIVNALWINIDRWVGAFIAIVIMGVAIELFVNVVVTLVKRKEKFEHAYHIPQLISAVFRPGSFVFITRLVSGLLPAPKEDGGKTARSMRLPPNTGKWSARIIIALLAAAYLWSMFYQVPAGSEGLVFRFGRLVNTQQTVKPGWHLSLPWPIDSVTLVDTHSVKRLEIGRLKSAEDAVIWAREHEDTQSYVSGDNGFLSLYATLHYRIDNPYDYILMTGIDEQDLFSIAQQVITRVFSENTFYDLMLYRRQELIETAAKQIQEAVDKLNSGYRIVDLRIIDLHPPTEIATSFEAVVAAYQERETAINKAQRGATELTLTSRGQAVSITEKAQSDAELKRQRAQGETQAYLNRLAAYSANRAAVGDTLKTNKLTELLQNRPKTLVDPRTGIPAAGLLMLDKVSAEDGEKNE